MVLKKKAKVSPPDPTKPPIWFSYWVENEFNPFKQYVISEITGLKQEMAKTNARLDNIVKKNNLIE